MRALHPRITLGKGITLSCLIFTTELIKNPSNNVSVEEIFRVELEKTFNQLPERELACFLGYEKCSKDGYNFYTSFLLYQTNLH